MADPSEAGSNRDPLREHGPGVDPPQSPIESGSYVDQTGAPDSTDDERGMRAGDGESEGDATDLAGEAEVPVEPAPDAPAAGTDGAEGSGQEGPAGLDLLDRAAGVVPIAELSDVTKSYGDVQALGPMSLTLDGLCIGLLGPNGAGKTTLIRLLLGLLHPTSGSVRVLGEDVAQAGRSIRRRIGYVPEGEARFPHMTGLQSVAYAGRLVGMDPASAMKRAHQVLDFVELGEARYRGAATYSTGMRQRLKLAQALVHDPELLILDEPTEGVDPQVRDEILRLIRELSREHRIRILLSTHLLPDVERVATHAVVMDRGRVAASGRLEELQRTATRGHVVRVAGSPEPLLESLSVAGVVHQAMAPEVRVELEDPREVLRHVKEAGLVVRHLAPLQLRLEEAFEQALGGTGVGQDDLGAAPAAEAPATTTGEDPATGGES